jgi:hypothetical protein
VVSPNVIQRVQGGNHKAVYNLSCLATTSTGRKLELIAVLPVRSLT